MTIHFTGRSPIANGTLHMVLSGVGASTYLAPTSSWPMTIKPLPFANCSTVYAIPFSSGGYSDEACQQCAGGRNGDLPQCGVESQCYCGGSTPSCQFQFPFGACSTIVNSTNEYTAEECQLCSQSACPSQCLSDKCACSDFGNNQALDALAALTGTTSPGVNSAVIGLATVVAVVVVGGAAYFIIQHLRAASSAAAAALSAKSGAASGGESGVLRPLQSFFSQATANPFTTLSSAQPPATGGEE